MIIGLTGKNGAGKTEVSQYLVSRGFEHPPEIILPVYGLYAGYQNIVRLTYRFLDGSSKQAVTSITTATFSILA